MAGDLIMRSRDDLLFDLKLVDNLVGITFGKANIEFYFAGGSACALAGYIDRMTRDFDFVDRGYSSRLAKVLKLLEPYDLLTTYFAAIPRNYAVRADKIEGFNNISVYILSKEDIIASKIDRLAERDIEDINTLIKDIDRDLLNKCIDETVENIVYEDRKERYKKNVERFRKMYNV
jgi:hypothetical protein